MHITLCGRPSWFYLNSIFSEAAIRYRGPFKNLIQLRLCPHGVCFSSPKADAFVNLFDFFSPFPCGIVTRLCICTRKIEHYNMLHTHKIIIIEYATIYTRAHQSVLIKNDERGSCVVADDAKYIITSASVVYVCDSRQSTKPILTSSILIVVSLWLWKNNIREGPRSQCRCIFL